MPATKRPPIPVPLQVQVYFRDAWLCHVCRKPVIFHLALKYLAGLVQQRLPEATLAYWNPTWRRDQAPLLDELAASIDHFEAFSRLRTMIGMRLVSRCRVRLPDSKLRTAIGLHSLTRPNQCRRYS